MMLNMPTRCDAFLKRSSGRPGGHGEDGDHQGPLAGLGPAHRGACTSEIPQIPHSNSNSLQRFARGSTVVTR